ncbi:MAG: hypothetical protein BMS9Abin17_1601 [Acidimicrobiia bacterium]|nr:MAG: hypothetical protein BMS9Abin17_1601 [Acidimicrobiia bacterium]
MTDRDHADEVDLGASDDLDDIDPPWPWSFILLVVAGAIYLIFRFVEVGIKIFN